MLPCVFLYLFLKYLPLKAEAGLLGWHGPLPDKNDADVPLRVGLSTQGDEPKLFLVPVAPLWGLLKLVWLPPHLRWCRSRSTNTGADTLHCTP